MSDQLGLTGISNAPIDGYSSNTDVHTKSISNLPDLESYLRTRRLKPPKPKLGNLQAKTGNNNRPLHNGILDEHFTFGTLVNLPEIRRKQLQDIMKGERGLRILSPEMLRDIHVKFRNSQYKEQTSTKGSLSSNTTTTENTTITSTNMTTDAGVNVTPETTTKTITLNKITAIFTTTELASSEESVFTTENPMQEKTDHIETEIDLDGIHENLGEITPHGDSELILKNNTSHDNVIVSEESNDIKYIDTIIFPSIRADAKKRKLGRQLFCRKLTLENGNTGAQCCLRTLSCFDGLPRYLDEAMFHHGHTHYSTGERLHICHDIDDSLLCKSRVLNRPSCRAAAKTINRKIQPQMRTFTLFQHNLCSKDMTFPVIPSTTTTVKPKTHHKQGVKDFGPIPGAMVPFIGGAIVGLFLLITILLCVICCRKYCKRSKRRPEVMASSNLSTSQSSRYVTYNRRKSSVYEEIDENHMVSNEENMNRRNNDQNMRKDPSAPNEHLGRSENPYYLSPTSSLPYEKTEDDKRSNDFGYLDLETDENGQSYAKLKTDGDYIRPDQIATSPPPKITNQKEEYHMYFVLEKENPAYENDK